MTRLLIISIVALLATSCTKSTVTPPAVPVNINGKAYSTVVIRNQTWTSQNYDGPGGIVNPTPPESIYGKYYTAAEMNAIVLPKGWRVPTKDDFVKLIVEQGQYILWEANSILTMDSLTSTKLRSTKNWIFNGNNFSGFNAEPAGLYNNYESKDVIYFQERANFWSSTASGTQTHYEFWMYGTDVPVGGIPSGGELDIYGFDQYDAMSLRFVKDN